MNRMWELDIVILPRRRQDPGNVYCIWWTGGTMTIGHGESPFGDLGLQLTRFDGITINY